MVAINKSYGPTLVVAAIIDGEAYQSLHDGRNKIPGSLWYLRREVAEAKASQIIAYLASLPNKGD